MGTPRKVRSGPGRARRRWQRLAGLTAAGVALVVLAVAGANAYVLLGGDGETTDEPTEVPPAEVAIVPGALVNPDGTMSTMLADRVYSAAALYRAGKVEKILVSGDHGSWAYDEPGTMRRALVRAGVEPRDVFEDHAGFETWATMVRARSIFAVRDAVVVTQGFHLGRALYLADAAGIEASGFVADRHPYGVQGTRSDARELLSRVKAVVDVSLDSPAVAGPRIPIASSDGRRSWGPDRAPGAAPSS